MASRTVGTLHFIVYRYICASGAVDSPDCAEVTGLTVMEVQEEFFLTRERAIAILRKLEGHGFIYRARSGDRKNGVVYRANLAVCGAPCILTTGAGTILPR